MGAALTPAGHVRLCGVQLAPSLGRTDENAEVAAAEVRTAAAEGARLVVFPEAALTGYVFESREEARAAAVSVDEGGPEAADRGALATVARACRDTGVWAVVGAIERAGDALHNTAFVLGPGGLVGRFRKVHTLCLGADRFTRPGKAFHVFDLPLGRVGVHICYDGSFPEGPRVLRLLGARLILLPTNWPDLTLKEELVRVRAYENRAFYVAVNRRGTERGVRFEGGSSAAGPFGGLLARAGPDEERFHLELDLSEAEESRVVVRPGEYEYDRVADRNPGAYGPLTGPAPEGRRTGSRRAGE